MIIPIILITDIYYDRQKAPLDLIVHRYHHKTLKPL